MPAENIFEERHHFISGVQKSAHLMKVGNGWTVHRGESFNIDMGSFVNAAYYALNHKRQNLPKIANGFKGWLSGAGHYITGSEQCSRFRYGDWNTQNLYHAYGWAKAAGYGDLVVGFEGRIQNLILAMGLSAGWVPRQTKWGIVHPVTMCGNRSWVVKRKAGSDKYWDSQGRWNLPYNLEYTPLEPWLNWELGLGPAPHQAAVKAYSKITNGRNYSALTIQQKQDLNRILRMHHSLGEEDMEAVKRVVGQLGGGPYFKEGIEILKTTHGVAFVVNKTKGGSTAPMPGFLWVENPAHLGGHFRRISHWDVDKRFGWVTTSRPKRKDALGASAEIIKKTDELWRVQAHSKNRRYDVADREWYDGPAFADITGRLVYHVRSSKEGAEVEFANGSWNSHQPPSKPKKGSWLQKLIDLIRSWF